jgi:adenylate cyclase
MRIRTTLLFLLAFQFILVCALIALAVAMQQTQLLAEEAEEQRFQSFQLADELRQSSDDLTRFARTYVTTGDDRYETFYNDVIAIRNGLLPRPDGYEGIYWDLIVAGLGKDWPDGPTVSLRNRMLDAGFTNAEFEKLSESQHRSDSLIRLETVAMNAMRGNFDDGTGTFSTQGEPDQTQAIALVHGERYHAAKAQIMAPIRDFMNMIDARTIGRVASLNRREYILVFVDIGVALLLLVGTLIAVSVILKRVLRPIEALAATANKVSQGDRSARANLSGAGEIAAFGTTFDHMVDAVDQHVSDLESAQSELAEQAKSLEHERHQSEKLLLNVLPAAIATRLKAGETTIAESYPEVTVLFSDIVGFTKLSAKIGAKQVVDMLNEVFGLLDELALKHGIEKIKTIGDCYMVVAGVPDRSPTHAQQIAAFAIEMQETIQAYAAKAGTNLSLRTGVHTGTVVAGIVGTSKFAYDLWGDVVNVASRMESTSEPGKIQVSDAVRIRLADDYLFEARGDVEIKGKGPMHTWYLIGERHPSTTSTSVDEPTPID